MFHFDENILFYADFPKYATFVPTYEFLNPGDDSENIRYGFSSERAIHFIWIYRYILKIALCS